MHLQLIRLVFVTLAAAQAILPKGAEEPAPCVEAAIAFKGAEATPVELVVSARPVTGSSEDVETRAQIMGSGGLSLALADGTWQLSLKAPGYWAESQTITVAAGRGKAEFSVWPAGRISGSVRAGKTSPAGLSLVLDPSPGTAGPEATIPCPVLESRWECDVPAGVFDVQVRARGFVPAYYWASRIDAGKTKDIGVVELRSGASLSGYVKTSEGALDPLLCHVAARPSDLAPGARGRAGLTVPVNSKGFFHLDGIPPGSYFLRAAHRGFAPATVTVRVLADLHADLLEPLVLRRPRTLDVVVVPPLDPWGKPWRVSVHSMSPETPEPSASASSYVSQEGRWVHDNLVDAKYWLSIDANSGDRWQGQPVDVYEGVPVRHVMANVLAVRGAVRLGKDPLKATVRFGGEHGNQSVSLQSNEDGEFQGFLPRAGAWDVSVQSESPPVKASLGVEVRRSEQESESSVDIALPNSSLTGRVVDEERRPVKDGVVNLYAKAGQGGLIQLPIESGGYFQVRGLAPQTYAVSAMVAPNLESESQEVTLEEGAEPPPLTIVVKRDIRILVNVESAFGPVPGATVIAFPGAPASTPLAVPVRTDWQGRAEVRLPSNSKEMRIRLSPPGFSMRFLTLPTPPDRRVTISVDQLGGTLVIEVPEMSQQPAEQDVREAVILRNGHLRLASATAHEWGGKTELFGRGRRITIPNLEAGEYLACMANRTEMMMLALGVRPSSCVVGVVPPLSEAILKIPPMAPSGDGKKQSQ